VVLGYLRPELFLGGRLKLQPDLAAEAILVVASHAMADAIHEMTAGQGSTPARPCWAPGG
jgi:hypothetical protein